MTIIKNHIMANLLPLRKPPSIIDFLAVYDHLKILELNLAVQNLDSSIIYGCKKYL